MRIVVALGGNALLRRGEKPDAAVQLGHVQAAAEALKPLAALHEIVICHGNGPQIGLLALESEADASLTRPYPLDVLNAQTQGMIGYWLAQALRNAGVHKPVVSLVTQTVVASADPAFAAPTKFIGPVWTRQVAEQMAVQHGWSTSRDGDGWRRVVPSPEPVTVVEQSSIKQLLRTGSVVVCGGGGAPVVDDGTGQLRGVEAVIDKDLTAVLLAFAVDADRLLVLTDVPAVMKNYGKPDASPLQRLGLDELAGMQFAAGSMGPKIEACRRFVSRTGRPAAIGELAAAAAVLRGDAGTTITVTFGPVAHDGGAAG